MRRTRAERGFSIALGAFACVLAVHLFLQSPFFRLRQIDVVGAVTLAKDDIITLAGIQVDTHIFDIDLKLVERRLRTEPRVAAVRFKRRLPARIVIELEERVPVAQVAAAGGLWLVDATGFNMGENQGELSLLVITTQQAGLTPVMGKHISDPAVRSAAGLAGDLPGYVSASLAEIRAVTVDNLELLTRDGIVVRFGSWSDVQLKTDVFWSLLQQLHAKGEQPQYIDVIRPESPVIR